MNDSNEASASKQDGEDIGFSDLGDAKLETKQVAPVPPYYFDNTFGFGWRPNG